MKLEKGFAQTQTCTDSSDCGSQYCYTARCIDNNANCFGLGKAECEIACPSGFYTDSTNDSECKPCPPNFNCANERPLTQCSPGQWSSEGVSGCESCPAGFICTGSSNPQYCSLLNGQIPNADSSATACIDCPAGQHCWITSSGVIQQDPCATGFESPAGESICTQIANRGDCSSTQYFDESIPGCTTCPTGKYCVDGFAFDCTPGTVRNGNTCRTCNAGSQCSNGQSETSCTGQTYSLGGDNQCNTAPPGHEMTNSRTAVKVCDDGYYKADVNSNCQQCPVGSYCPSATQAVPCPTGYYQDRPGQTTCTICPAGASCDGSSTSSCTLPEYSFAGMADCVSCPAGHICPDVEGDGMAACEPGTYVNNNNCQQCPAGSKCPSPIQGPIACTCTADFCSYASGQGNTFCTICPAGSSCTTTGTTNCNAGQYSLEGERNCNNCPDGHFCPSTDMKPIPCAMGYYPADDKLSCIPCPAGESCDDSSKTSCPTGEYSLAGWLSCVPCPAGFQCPGQSTVQACDLGQYSRVGEIACSNCPAGSYCPVGSDPIDCPVGHICPARSQFPDPCDPGTYNAVTEQTSCTNCPAGYYCPSATGWDPTSDDRLKCPRGHFCEARAAAPSKCPSGSYNDQFGNSNPACTPCDAGKYCPAGTSNRGYVCPAGHWCPGGTGDADLSGNACPAGTYSEREGRTSNIDCHDCPKGHYCPAAGTATPMPCPPGTYQSSTRGTTCNQCDAGMACTASGLSQPDYFCHYGHNCPEGTNYPDSWGAITNWQLGERNPATACPAGKYIELTDESQNGDCINCPLGNYCFQSTGGKIRKPMHCPMGYYCDGKSIDSVRTWNQNGENFDPVHPGRYSFECFYIVL